MTPPEAAAARSSFSRRHRPIGASVRFPWAFVSATDHEKDPPWTWHRVLAAGTSNVLVAEPFSGKSWFAAHAALRIAVGGDLFGRPVRPGLVIYIAAERAGETRRRLRAMRVAAGVDDPDIVLVRRGPSLTNADDIDQILDEINLMRGERGAVALVVIDTYSASMAGQDESGSVAASLAAQSIQRIIDATGACVLVLHHPPKGGKGARGHGGLVGSADAVLELSERNGVRTVTLVQANHDADIGVRMAFTIEDGVVVEMKDQVWGCAPGAATAPPRRSGDVRFEELVRGLADGCPASRKTVLAQARALEIVTGSRDTTLKAVNRKLAAMAENGKIRIDGDLITVSA